MWTLEAHARNEWATTQPKRTVTSCVKSRQACTEQNSVCNSFEKATHSAFFACGPDCALLRRMQKRTSERFATQMSTKEITHQRNHTSKKSYQRNHIKEIAPQISIRILRLAAFPCSCEVDVAQVIAQLGCCPLSHHQFLLIAIKRWNRHCRRTLHLIHG